MFGNPETTPGGRALKFYTSIRLDIRRIQQLKEGDTVVGGRVRVKVVKNKCAPPFRQTEFDIMYGEGISRPGRTHRSRRPGRSGEKSGTWFSHDEERIGQGRENAKTFLREHLEVAEKIERAIRNNAGLGGADVMGGVAGDDEQPPDETPGETAVKAAKS